MSFIYGTLSEARLKRLLGDLQKKTEETVASSESLASEVNSLSIDSEQYASKLANYGERITANESSITSQWARINSLEALTSSHTVRLTDAEADILAAKSRLDGHDTDIDAITRSIVTNEAEFTAAIVRSERIYIRGTVTIAGQFTNTIPLHIIGEPGSKLIFTAATYCIDMKASLTIEHLHVEGISRDQGYFINIGGTTRAGGNAWLRLTNCTFRLMGNVVTMSGSGSAPLGPRTVVKHCRVSEIGSTSFTQFGQEAAFYLTWHLGLTLFDDVHFEDIHGNALYFGQSGMDSIHALGEAIIVQNCYLKDFNRNGIEAFSAARAFILNNYLTGGLGSFTNTPSGSGIGISVTGGRSVVALNILKDVRSYGIELIGYDNLATSNTVDGLTADDGNVIGISIDNGYDTSVLGNIFKNLKHGANAKYAIKARNSQRITIAGHNRFRDVSYGAWVAEGCEDIDFTDNQLWMERDSGSLAVRAFMAFSGNRHMVMQNRARLGPTLAGIFTATDKEDLFQFDTGEGGYYDYTSGLITAGGTPTSFGNLSLNLVA